MYEVNKLNLRIKELERKIEYLEDCNNEYVKELDKQDNRIEELESDIDTLNQEKVDLENEMFDLNEKIEELQGDAEYYKEEMSYFESEYEDIGKELNDLQTDYDNLENLDEASFTKISEVLNDKFFMIKPSQIIEFLKSLNNDTKYKLLEILKEE